MILELFTGYVIDALRAGEPWTQDAKFLRSISRPAGRLAALRSPQSSIAVSSFARKISTDQLLWSGRASAQPSASAYDLVLNSLLKPGPLLFRRSQQLQRSAAALLKKSGLTVSEMQIATALEAPCRPGTIVTVNRALLGGARILSTGSLQDYSWQSALRKLFSV